jgi:hypothetical protein
MPWVRARNFQKGSRGNLGEVEVFNFQKIRAKNVGLDHVKCNFAQKLPFATILLHFKQFLPNLQCLQWLQTAFRQRIKQLGPCRAPKVGKKKHVLPFYGIFGHFPMFLLCCQADSKLKKTS